jgi:hypothetical protein
MFKKRDKREIIKAVVDRLPEASIRRIYKKIKHIVPVILKEKDARTKIVFD